MARVDLTLQCDVCKTFGRDPGLVGMCVCGAESWTETAPRPAPPSPARPARPASWGRPAWPPSRPVGPPARQALSPRPEPYGAVSGGSAVIQGVSRQAEPVQPPAPGFVDGSSVGRILVDDFAGARVNELLGGIKRGAVVQIAGRGGHGKSTATADLVAHVVEHWESEPGRLRMNPCRIYWLDADQKDLALVRELFITADAEDVFDRRIQLLPERTAPWTWREALMRAPPDARILVLDSLETWAPRSDTDKRGLLRELRSHPAWLKVVIAGTNDRGQISGSGEIERANDVSVFALRIDDPDEQRFILKVGKKRWKPCESARARGAGESFVWPPPAPPPEPPPSEDAPAEAQPTAEPPASAAPPEREPRPQRPLPGKGSPIQVANFSVPFLRQMAMAPIRESEDYKMQLRLGGVHAATVEGWQKALDDERKRLVAEMDEIEVDDGDDGEGPGPGAMLH